MSQTKAQLIDPVDGTIVNADINASAAIAGSKISPDFGSQNIVTTGTLTSGSASFSSAVTTSADVLSITGTSFADNEKIFTTFKRGTIHLGKLGVEVVGAGQAGNLLFETASSGTSAEHMRLDSNGKLLIGHNAAVFSSTAKFQLSGDGHHYLQVSRFTADANANRLRFFKSRSATVGTASTTSSGDQLGLVDFYGVDASNNSRVAASINGEMDGSSSTNTMPGRITFRTTPTTFSGTLERMRIDSSGRVGIGTTSPTRMLHIKSNAANSSQIALIDNDSTNEVFRVGQQSDGDGFLQLLDDAGAVQIGLEATGDSFFVGGKLGLGVSAPDTLLHLRGDDTAVIRLENSDDSLGANQIIGGLEFEKTDPNGAGAGVVGGVRMYSQGVVGENTYLAFSTASSSTNNVEHMRLEDDGDLRLSSDNAATNFGFIDGWTDSTKGNFIIDADKSQTGQSSSTDGSAILFRTRGGERARIQHAGGISFNGDTAAANALDDYEEGTHQTTVTISGNTSFSYSSRNLAYTKIGRVVHLIGRINMTGAGGGSSFEFSLPFACANGDPDFQFETSNEFQVIRGDDSRTFRIREGESVAKCQNDGTAAAIGASDPHINVNLTYFTNA